MDATNHYSAKGVSFDYPAGWEERRARWWDLNPVRARQAARKEGMELLVVCQDLKRPRSVWSSLKGGWRPGALATVLRNSQLLKEGTLEDVIRRSHKSEHVTIEKQTHIQGQVSFRFTYTSPSGEEIPQQLMFATKDGRLVYEVRCFAPDAAEYEDNRAAFDLILVSFRIA